MFGTSHRPSRAHRLSLWAAVAFLFLALTARGDEQTYIVQRSDTLSGIARRFGISVSQLADRNGLNKNRHIFVGQHLIVPSLPSPPNASRPEVGDSIQKAIDKAPVAPGRWKYVVIHHSGGNQGDLKSLDRYHKEERHMEHGLAYHFLIGNGNGMRDGEIAVGDRWREQLHGGHLHSDAQNKIAIGICLIGNLDERKPTVAADAKSHHVDGGVAETLQTFHGRRENPSTDQRRQDPLSGEEFPHPKFRQRPSQSALNPTRISLGQHALAAVAMSKLQPFRKLGLAVAGISLLALVTGLVVGNPGLWRPAVVAFSVCLAVGLGAIPALKGYQFTAWIIAAVVSAMIYPMAFLKWGDFDLRNKWLILIVVQLVMFGMGTQMSLADFAGVVKTPRGVIVGILCHFSVMPLVGYSLTKIFHFEPEIAAGIILIGSCSSGLASNVMAYIAKSNLVLSVTVTAITTMIAPIMTPFLMTRLAGTLVDVSFFKMMMEIIKIVLVPIGAALLHDYLKGASPRGRNVVSGVAAAGVAWMLVLALGGWGWLKGNVSETSMHWIGIGGFLLGAMIVGLAYHWLTRWFTRLDRLMPIASMAGIVYFTTVTTAAGRDNLLNVGALLFIVSAIHNAAGYGFGYWLSRAAGLDKNSARSVAFEVGLQNGGMASGIAGSMGKLGTMGLAAAIFSPWMNISGSVLANYWRKRPVEELPDGLPRNS